MELLVYYCLIFALYSNVELICSATTTTTTTTDFTQQSVQYEPHHSFSQRPTSNSHHPHHQQLMQNRYSTNKSAHTKHHSNAHVGSTSHRAWMESAHRRYSHGTRPIQSEQAITSPSSAITSNVNTKLRPITLQSQSSSPSNQVARDSLKLTLIQTNGQSFVANKYPDSFGTHLNRWPIAPQTPSYNVKWKTANNPFASHFNPSIGTMPVSTGADAAATPYRPPQHVPSSTVFPTVNVYRMYTDHRVHVHKHHTGHGRHVCVDHKAIITPSSSQSTTTTAAAVAAATAAATQEQRKMPCRNGSPCEESRLNYEIASRRIGHTIYNCCPGWTKISKNSHGCTKPICKLPCRNNGKCVKPEQCLCPAGYTGRHCEYDVNECETEKPCDQMCHNTDGSYYCSCRLGFLLHSDRQSCKKIDSSFGNDGSDTAFEARDLENDVDNDVDLTARMNSIEKLMITEKERNVETNKLMQHTLTAMNHLKYRLDGLEHRQHEVNFLRDRLKSFELQTSKLQYAIDVLTNAVANH